MKYLIKNLVANKFYKIFMALYILREILQEISINQKPRNLCREETTRIFALALTKM